MKLVVILFFTTILATAAQEPHQLTAVSLLISAVVCGLSAPIYPRIRLAIGFAVGLNGLAFAYEKATGQQFLNAVGIATRVDYLQGDFSLRANGVMGHPLMSGMTLLFLGAVLAMSCWSEAGNRRVQGLLTYAAVAASAAVLSGSRSVLIIGTLGVAGLWLAVLFDRRQSRGWKLMTYWLSLPVGAFVFAAVSTGALSSMRAFSFTGLTSSSSYTVRAGAIETLRYAEGAVPCEGVCIVAGRGFRSSTDFFSGREPSALVRTFDNIYVTMWFDFGLVGAFVLLVTLGVLVRARNNRTMAAFAFVHIALVGFFLDSLYSYALCALAATMTAFATNSSTKSGATVVPLTEDGLQSVSKSKGIGR